MNIESNKETCQKSSIDCDEDKTHVAFKSTRRKQQERYTITFHENRNKDKTWRRGKSSQVAGLEKKMSESRTDLL